MKNFRLITHRTAAVYIFLLLTVSLTSCGDVPQTTPQSGDAGQSPVIVEPTPGDSFDDSGQTPVESDPGPAGSEEESQDYSGVIDDPIFGGIMVLKDGLYTAVDHFGQPMGFAADAAGQTWVHESAVGVTKKNVLLATNDGLELIDMEGSRLLPFAGTKSIMSADISRDGSRIAWVTDEVIGDGLQVELWTSNFDGSDAVKVFELTPAETSVKPTAVEILGWTADGKLLYATRADGIGGYILYMGWNDLFIYDPVIGRYTSLYIDDGTNWMCVNSISNNYNLVAIGCKTIRIQNLDTGAVVEYPAVAEQNIAGSAKFSPNDTLVAYSIARGNPDDEYSQLLVAPADGSSSPMALDTLSKGYFGVLGWIDENTVLYTTSPGFSTGVDIWRIETDGSSEPFRIAEGVFVGFIY